jgi:S1-C subfamily serine protease
MITFFRNSARGIRRVFVWTAMIVVIMALAIIADRVVFPFLASIEPFSKWALFSDRGENTTIITNREEIIIRDDDRLDRIVENVHNSTGLVVVDSPSISGEPATAIAVSNDGLFVTILPEETEYVDAKFSVISFDGVSFPASFFGYDSFFGLTYLKVDGDGFSPVSFADSDDFGSGRKVIALSASESSDRNRITSGIIRQFDSYSSIASQTLASTEKHEGVFDVVFSGDVSSGSAVMSYGGEFVGIVGKKYVGNEVVSYVLDANAVSESLNTFSPGGDSRVFGFVGTSYTPISPYIATLYDLPVSEGVWLAFPDRPSGAVMLFGSPAQQAGLRYGDIVISVNDTPITAQRSFSGILQAFSPGDTVSLRVLRDDAEITLSLTLDDASAWQ